jgi:hypothetical protein
VVGESGIPRIVASHGTVDTANVAQPVCNGIHDRIAWECGLET